MRIISGKARGTKLYSLEGITTRPTLDRVKEALFNIIQNDVIESVFLDLFAGSGAIGLEAASRGAKKAILCEKNADAVNIIKQNIEKTQLQNTVELHKKSFEQVLKNIDAPIDIAYIDPPYKTNYAYEAIKVIVEKNLMNKDGIIIIETDEKERILEQIDSLDVEIISQRKYGRVHLIFVKPK